MEERIQAILKERFGRDLDNCTKSEIFEALMVITKQEMAGRKRNTGSKKLYYISAEFLIGKLLSNNLINLGMYEEVEKALGSSRKRADRDRGDGNGAVPWKRRSRPSGACFLDSIATLGPAGETVSALLSLRVCSRQLLVDHKQKEVKNPWITNESWLVRQPVSFAVPYKNFTMHSTLYDIDVPGYNNGCNRLHLFDVDTVDESIVPSDSINFDKHQIQKNLTLFLYPDDSDRAGQLLRIYQQYFMVSNGAQFILMECEQKGYDLHKLYDHVVIPDQRYPSVHGHSGADPSAAGERLYHAGSHRCCKQDLCLHQPHHPGRGTGKMADRLPRGGCSAPDADYPRAGRTGKEEIQR